jgi:hypothetical protein
LSVVYAHPYRQARRLVEGTMHSIRFLLAYFMPTQKFNN